MFENTIRRMPRPQDVATMTTQQLRRLPCPRPFRAGRIARHVHRPRPAGGRRRDAGQAGRTAESQGNRAGVFLERRELGAINVGGAGTVHTDGKTFALDRLDCVYLPMGTKSVTFESKDAKNPAKFYFLSCPAHAAHPAATMKPKDASPVPLGSQANANQR